MKKSQGSPLDDARLSQLAEELDAIHAREVGSLGASDARYIRRAYAMVRYTGLAGRALLFLGMFPPAWLIGTLLLALSKIIDNMEVGHNVMHGQYDWMGDPRFNGHAYEWDIAGTSDNWRKTHNFMHHTYTNIKDIDEDIGYGILRLFPEQAWRPFHLLQPVYVIIFALLFQWGIAIQELRLGQLFQGRKKEAFHRALTPVRQKAVRLLLRDYVLFPALAGPFFLFVFTGNLVANGIRNVWTFVIIFCGHFTRDVQLFPRSVMRNESRGHWYLRQIQGSSNLRGGALFHFMTGNLSHQIEHHLFPDIPAWRYARLAPEIRAICQRYGIHYNTGSLFGQFSQVCWRILRHAVPSSPARGRVRTAANAV